MAEIPVHTALHLEAAETAPLIFRSVVFHSLQEKRIACDNVVLQAKVANSQERDESCQQGTVYEHISYCDVGDDLPVIRNQEPPRQQNDQNWEQVQQQATPKILACLFNVFLSAIRHAYRRCNWVYLRVRWQIHQYVGD